MLLLKILAAGLLWYLVGLLLLTLLCTTPSGQRALDKLDQFVARHEWLETPLLLLTAIALMGPFGLVHVFVVEVQGHD